MSVRSGGAGGGGGSPSTVALTSASSLTQTVNATSADGFLLANTTAAAAGAQQWSPRLHWTGQGWKTTATAASQSVDWIAEVQPVQGTTAPTSNWVLSSSINGAAYTAQSIFYSDGSAQVGTAVIGNGGAQQIYLFATAAAARARTYSLSSMALDANQNGLSLGSGLQVSWLATAAHSSFTRDLMLSRGAAATLQLGAANAAAPVAQTLQAQGSRSGTDTNTGGASLTVRAGAGTGTGTLSSLVLQSPVAVASGTGAQTQTTGLTIKNGVAISPDYTVATLPTASTVPYGRCMVSDALTTLTLGIGTTVAGGGANKTPVWSDGTNWIYG